MKFDIGHNVLKDC